MKNLGLVGMAAELATASECCRRNLYAQLTFGNLKRTDILVLREGRCPIRIEVKGKKDKEWPNCGGISNPDSILVLVDFQGKSDLERPDFYIMTCNEWVDFVKNEIDKHPGGGIVLGDDNVPVWTKQINKAGKPYRGIGIKKEQVSQHLEKWKKITG